MVKKDGVIFEKFSNYSNDIKNGKLYCNSIKYFRKLENGGAGIADENEGKITFTVKEKKYTIEYDGDSNFIFCVTIHEPGFVNREKEQGLYLYFYEEHNRNLEMKYKDIILIDAEELKEKIEKKCKELNINCIHCEVEYVDLQNIPQYAKDILVKEPYKAVFFKDKKFKWQKEYRFLFYNINPELIQNDHFELNIGSLCTTKIESLEEMGKRFQFHV